MISISPKSMSAGASRRRSAAFIDQSVALAALPRGHRPIRLKRASATRLALPYNINFTPTIPPSPNFGVEPGCAAIPACAGMAEREGFEPSVGF